MKIKILCFIFLSVAVLFSQEFIISNIDFTNQNYTFNQLKSFIKSFENNKLTDQQIWFINWQCRYNQLNPIMFLAKMEAETGLVCNYITNRYKYREHRAMGYGLIFHKKVNGKKYYKYGFFKVQVNQAAITLKKYFDRWNSEKQIFLKCEDIKIKPVNAASYSLLIYTPFWGLHSEYGYQSIGNLGFQKIFNRFKKKWYVDNLAN